MLHCIPKLSIVQARFLPIASRHFPSYWICLILIINYLHCQIQICVSCLFGETGASIIVDKQGGYIGVHFISTAVCRVSTPISHVHSIFLVCRTISKSACLTAGKFMARSSPNRRPYGYHILTSSGTARTYSTCNLCKKRLDYDMALHSTPKSIRT